MDFGKRIELRSRYNNKGTKRAKHKFGKFQQVYQ